MADMATIAGQKADVITVGDRTAAREDAIDLLGSHLESLPSRIQTIRRVALGMFRGLTFGLVLQPLGAAPDAYLEGTMMRQYTLSRDHHGPRAILNALDRLANDYESECARVRQDLAIREGQLRDYQARLGVPFAHESYLTQLLALRDQLRLGLSASATEHPNGDVPTVGALAAEIKALKAAHTIDASPKRTGSRAASAAESVTTRILERKGAGSSGD
jgi:hypothetical protein